MGENYDFRFNPEPPSGEQIKRHKHFGALLQRYYGERLSARQRRARVLRLTYAGAAVAAALAAVIILLGGLFSRTGAPTLSPEEYFAQGSFVQPPLEKLGEPQYARLRVDVNQGGVYEYPSGARLVIPAAAFANQYGSLIQGEVDIYFREMYDFVDFFLAGIPLPYDSAGQRYQLESMGIIEIFALQDGQPVHLAPGKTIDVTLVSEINVPQMHLAEPPAFHAYLLDTFARIWAYQYPVQVEFADQDVLDRDDPLFPAKQRLLKTLDEIEARTMAERTAIEASVARPIEPLRPQRADGQYPTLELNLLDGNLRVEDLENGEVFSELRKLQQMYDGIIWQVSPNSPAIDERAFGVNWESVRIRQLNAREYELTLIHPQNQATLVVSPVLMGRAYEQALARYQTEFDRYQTALSQRDLQLKNARERLTATADQQKAEAYRAYEQELEAIQADGLAFSSTSRYSSKRKVLSRFQANGLGFWNCARPAPLPPNQIGQAAFKDQNGNYYRNHTAYMVDRSRNTIFRFYADGQNPVYYDSDSDNLLWIVTDGRKLAILTPESFRQSKPRQGSYTFQLNLLDKTFEGEDELRAALQF
jgi:hypothetical protein